MGVIKKFSTESVSSFHLSKNQALLKNAVQKIVGSRISDLWLFFECNFRLLAVMPIFGPEGVIAGYLLIVGV